MDSSRKLGENNEYISLFCHLYGIQSGDASAPWATLPGSQASRHAFGLGNLVGCERQTSEELLECLQQLEGFDKIVENQEMKVWGRPRERHTETRDGINGAVGIPRREDPGWSKCSC